MPTAGVSLLQGRQFTAADTAPAMRVAIVSRRMAERLWPGQEAVGEADRRRGRTSRGRRSWASSAMCTSSGTWEETWYVPYEQQAGTLAASTVHLMVRSQVDAAAVVAALRQATAAIDQMLPVREPSVMTTMWRDAQTPQRHGAAVGRVAGRRERAAARVARDMRRAGVCRSPPGCVSSASGRSLARVRGSWCRWCCATASC